MLFLCLYQLILICFLSYLQVPVTVYYESLCPDSAKFITEQIYPAVKSELKDFVDITWVPFGKSSVSKKENFSSIIHIVCIA